MRLHVLLATIFTLTLAAQGHITVEKTTIDLGQVDAAGAPVPFAFVIKNTGNAELRLQWLDMGHPAVLADIDKGLLAPGESTKIRGALEPRHLVGPFSTKIELHAEDIQSPIVPLEVKALVAPDIVMTSQASTTIDKLTWQAVHSVPAFTFQMRSGDPIDPEGVKVMTNTKSALSCAVTYDRNSLTVAPTISESLLPLVFSGHEKITVQIDNVEYVATVQWSREIPLTVARLEDGSFSITSTDKRPFKLGKITAEPKLTFRTKKLNDGFVATPVQPRKKPVDLQKVTFATNHPLKPSITWSAPITAK